jgi:hypothetical protein
MMLRRVDVRTPTPMPEYGIFEPTMVERAPLAYLVPAGLTPALERLAAHGVITSTLQQPVTLELEEFHITGSTIADRPFQGGRERTVTGEYRQVTRELPAGTVVVRVEQPLGRLAFYLLEPLSDDGLLNWGLLDEALGDAVVYPIVRTFGTLP